MHTADTRLGRELAQFPARLWGYKVPEPVRVHRMGPGELAHNFGYVMYRAFGLFDHNGNRVVVSDPFPGSELLRLSVIVHETTHWLQFHNRGYDAYISDMYSAEYEAYTTQMAWLTLNGADIRTVMGDRSVFSPENLESWTRSERLWHNDYQWLEPWKALATTAKEHKTWNVPSTDIITKLPSDMQLPSLPTPF